jgi:hypothetical protein
MEEFILIGRTRAMEKQKSARKITNGEQRGRGEKK